MMFDPGDVVLVRFPFSNLTSSKQRPALVLSHIQPSKSIGWVITSMITSQVDAPKQIGDVLLQDWKDAGLLYPSKLRIAKTATLDEELVQKKLGRISKTDFKKTQVAFEAVFTAWL